MPRKGENIYYRKKEKRWEARFRPPGGEKIISVYAPTYREAREKRQKVKEQYASRPVPKPKKSVKELLNEWLSDKESHIKSTSLNQYQKLSRLYIVPYLGAMQVEDLTAQKITEYVSALQKSDGKRHALSVGTISSVIVLLKMILKYAQKIYGFFIDLSDVVLPKKRHEEVDIYSEQEMGKIDQYAKAHPSNISCGIALAVGTGIREGEDCGLKWGDIDFAHHTLTVRCTVVRIRLREGGTKLVTQAPKTESSARTIPIPEALIPVLRTQKRSHGDADYILTGTKKPMDPRTLQNRYRSFLKKAGIRYRKFHILRHSFATHSAQSGMSADCLKRILGHSSVKTTMTYYTHTTSDYMRKMMEAVYERMQMP